MCREGKGCQRRQRLRAIRSSLRELRLRVEIFFANHIAFNNWNRFVFKDNCIKLRTFHVYAKKELISQECN